MNWYLTAIKKCTKFKGRARRKEYWYFSLFNAIIYLGLNIAEEITSVMIFSEGFSLNLLLETINSSLKIATTFYIILMLMTTFSVSVRRLHDVGKSAWWVLFYFVPIIGSLVLLYFYVQDSQPEKNQYGRNPKEIQ